MRFPSAEKLCLPCRFEQLFSGQMSADGRRVLPIIVLRPATPVADAAANVALLGVVDRHHVMDPALVGALGVAQLVWLLSSIRAQETPFQQRLVPDDTRESRAMSMMPAAYGRVVEVLAWEEQKQHLPYETLYTELLLDVGVGVVGVRTSLTAPNLAEALGTPRIEAGNYIAVLRSRIDILGFVPMKDEGRTTNV